MSLQGQTGLWGGVGGGIIGAGPEGPLYDWETTTFTPSGAYGNAGPSQTQFDSTQAGKPFLTDYSRCVNGIQYVRLPKDGDYRFAMYGAYGGPGDPWQGGDTASRGGIPWFLDVTMSIDQGTWIGIVIGQKGTYGTSSSSNGGGGGGGTYVFTLDSDATDATEFTTPHIYTCTPTAIAVAAGGNGANWDGWVVAPVNSKGPTSSGSEPYTQYPYGRGAFGGSFVYTNYWWVAPGISWYHGYSHDYKTQNGAPIKDSSGTMHNKSSFGGICLTNNSTTAYYNAEVTSQCGEGGNGGFGGGGGAQFEGAGGGGYWGGAANFTNDYNNAHAFGAHSYVKPGITQTSSVLSSSNTTVPNAMRSNKVSYPWTDHNIDGRVTISYTA